MPPREVVEAEVGAVVVVPRVAVQVWHVRREQLLRVQRVTNDVAEVRGVAVHDSIAIAGRSHVPQPSQVGAVHLPY